MKEYIRRTEALRKILMLFVTLKEPYKVVQRATVAEWLSMLTMLSGQKRTPDSVRSGSSSHEILRVVDLAMVIVLMIPHINHYYKLWPLSFARKVLL